MMLILVLVVLCMNFHISKKESIAIAVLSPLWVPIALLAGAGYCVFLGGKAAANSGKKLSKNISSSNESFKESLWQKTNPKVTRLELINLKKEENKQWDKVVVFFFCFLFFFFFLVF